MNCLLIVANSTKFLPYPSWQVNLFVISYCTILK